MIIDNGNASQDLFQLKRTERKSKLRDIVIEAMRELNTNPITKNELQKLVRIRRKTYRKLLLSMVGDGVIERLGSGVKADPYKYSRFARRPRASA